MQRLVWTCVLATLALAVEAADTTSVANQEVAVVGTAGDLILPSAIYGTRGTAFEQVDEVTAKIEAMLAARNLKVSDLMRHTIFLKTGAQEPSKVFTRLIGDLRRMGPELTNNATAGTIVLVPSFPDPATQFMIEFVGGRAPNAMNRVPIMFGPRLSVESVGNEQFVASYGLEGLDFYGAATDGEIATYKTLDGELEKLVAILGANMAHAGLSIANVVSYNFYVTKGTDPVYAATKLHQLMSKRAPDIDKYPSTGTVVVLDGATIANLTVQLNVIASRAQPATLSRVPLSVSSTNKVSQSVTSGGAVFLSAVDGIDHEKKGAIAGDAVGQAQTVARNISNALRNAGGLKMSDVARFDVYVKQGEDPTATLAAFHKAARKLDPSFDPKKTAALIAVVQGFTGASTKVLVSAVAAHK